MDKTKNNHTAFSTQGLLDIILFFSIFWMVMFHNKRKRPKGQQGQARGQWRPNMMYLPVLLLRWVFVPHHDWTKEHMKYQNSEDQYGHHYHHHPHHDQQSHHHHHHPHHTHHHYHHHLNNHYGHIDVNLNRHHLHKDASKLSDDGVREIISHDTFLQRHE